MSPPVQISCSDDVYRYFVERYPRDEEGDPHPVALFAFALVEQDRVDWFAHLVALDAGAAPSEARIAQWYREKPPSYFAEKDNFATNWLDEFAHATLERQRNDIREQAVRDFVGNLRSDLTNFKANLINNIGYSVIGNFVFAILLVALVAVINIDFSPIAWAKKHLAGG